MVLPVMLLILLVSWKNTVHSPSSWPPSHSITRNVKVPLFILLTFPSAFGVWGLREGAFFVWPCHYTHIQQTIIPHLPSHNPFPSSCHYRKWAHFTSPPSSSGYPVIFLHWKVLVLLLGGFPVETSFVPLYMSKPTKVHSNRQMLTTERKVLQF